MIALYTEIFEDYLKRNDIEGHFFHDVIRPKLEQIPNFTLADLNLNFLELFIEKYDLEEIGSETEQLFEHYLNETLNEVIADYVPKIKMYIQNFDELLSRKVRLEFKNTATETPNGKEISNRKIKNDNYLNPIYPLIENEQQNVLDTNAKTEVEDERSFVGRKTETIVSGYRDQAYSYFKTNPDMLDEVMKLKNIYIEAINKFERCFMVII